ncbi:hypothetical protein NL676_011996 [Syzygium grande]|nr:hypothetical protein NL676_011996 [Syzygium grande]
MAGCLCKVVLIGDPRRRKKPMPLLHAANWADSLMEAWKLCRRYYVGSLPVKCLPLIPGGRFGIKQIHQCNKANIVVACGCWSFVDSLYESL